MNRTRSFLPALALLLAGCSSGDGAVSSPTIGALPADAEPLVAGSSQVVTLAEGDGGRFYRLSVPDGGIVEVAASNRPASRGSVYVALIHAEESPERDRVIDYRYAHAREEVSAVALRRVFSAEQAGEYALFVHAAEPAELELALSTDRQHDAGVAGDAPATPQAARAIELGATYDGTVGDDDLEDHYRFAVPSAGQLTVTVANTSDTAFGCGARLFLDGASQRVEYVEPGEEKASSVAVDAGAGAGLVLHCNGDGSYRFAVALAAG